MSLLATSLLVMLHNGVVVMEVRSEGTYRVEVMELMVVCMVWRSLVRPLIFSSSWRTFWPSPAGQRGHNSSEQRPQTSTY